MVSFYLEVSVQLQVNAELLDEGNQHGVADWLLRVGHLTRLDVGTHVQHHIKVSRTQRLKRKRRKNNGKKSKSKSKTGGWGCEMREPNNVEGLLKVSACNELVKVCLHAGVLFFLGNLCRGGCGHGEANRALTSMKNGSTDSENPPKK